MNIALRDAPTKRAPSSTIIAPEAVAPLRADRPEKQTSRARSSEATMLDHALSRAAEGFRVFPLIPNGKTPALEVDWKAFATKDPAKIKRAWTCAVTGWIQPYNIGLALDADTLVVDVDVRNGKNGKEQLRGVEERHKPLPATYRVRTPTKGDHHYYRVSNQPKFKKNLTPDVDLKSLGGYVVGEGSVIDGVRYARVDGDAKHMAHLPDEWVAETSSQEAGERSAAAVSTPLVELDDKSAIKRAIDWLTTAAPDSGTYTVAARVKDFGVSEPQCVDLLMTHWVEARNLGKSEEHVAFRVHNAYRYGQSPIGVASPEAEFEAVEVEDRRAESVSGKPSLLDRLTAAALYPSHFNGKTVPPIDWLVPNFILDREVSLFSGNGGSGKSTIALQLGVALATGQPWLGQAVSGVRRCLHLSAEDGVNRLHRRLAGILSHHGLSWDDLSDRLVLMPWRDPVIGAVSRGVMEPTDFAKALEQFIAKEEFGFVVLDNLADVFAGNEIDRAHTTQFVGILNGINDRTGSATLLISHPSQRGKESGSGESGSTGWHNKVRSRLYLTESEKGDGSRTLESKKQQDGPADQKIKLHWSNGTFVPVRGFAPEDVAAANASAESLFLELLDSWAAGGRFVSDTANVNYAPKRFSEDPRSIAVSKADLAGAMNRLFAKREIVVEEYKNEHRDKRKRIVRAAARSR